MKSFHTFIDRHNDLSIGRVHSLELLATDRRDKLVSNEQTDIEFVVFTIRRKLSSCVSHVEL